MKISSLTDIVEGKLLNAPAISFVTQIHTEITKVNDGDAFFTDNQDDLNKAIQKGIFAIIVDFEPLITDNEIAWIKVENLTKAKTNILRYKFSERKSVFIQVDEVFYQLLNLFKTKELIEKTEILTNNITKDFELLNNLPNDKTIFSTNLKFIEAISPNINILTTKDYDIKNLTIHSLFEISFSYKDKFFEHIRLPKVYLNYFIQILELFDYKIDIKRLNSFELFKPIFINKSTQPVSLGQTNRFILANSNDIICNKEIEFLKEFYSYAIIKVIDVSLFTDEEIYLSIKKLNFNALYLKGKDIKHINNILEQNNNSVKLF
ncbi:MAG: hypothetical protein U9R16_04060 [Campylobacterota bacterium]|nr:hypothetical protein [Campylobacterota bacterium]